tara:strand:+ start:419 stop:523 length:105 start_codon:yes stop_codon:yes gene_type:complete
MGIFDWFTGKKKTTPPVKPNNYVLIKSIEFDEKN